MSKIKDKMSFSWYSAHIMALPVIPKKSLGQNFLNSKRVIETIVNQTYLQQTPWIVEIGPGLGAITEKLLETESSIIAIEKDTELYNILQEKFIKDINSGKLHLINEDVMNYNIQSLIKNSDYQVAANIPYNITGLIFRHFLTLQHQPKQMTILIQKEVATRILARDNKHSLLSLSIHVFGTPKLVTHVAKGNFNPPPKVDSSVITISNISRTKFISEPHEELFFKIIHAGFAHKRKIALKNIAQELNIDPKFLETIFQEEHLSLTVRAEDISLETWLSLTKKLL